VQPSIPDVMSDRQGHTKSQQKHGSQKKTGQFESLPERGDHQEGNMSQIEVEHLNPVAHPGNKRETGEPWETFTYGKGLALPRFERDGHAHPKESKTIGKIQDAKIIDEKIE
jgi:hypothetical protein